MLTPREWEVLGLIDQGLTNDQIAEKLGISRDGAKYHVAQILSKLGVSSRHEATAVAYQNRGPILRRFALLLFGWKPALTQAGKVVGGGAIAAAVAAVALLAFLVLVKRPAKPVFDLVPGLYVLDLDSGQVERKTDLRGSYMQHFEWSPDGRAFILHKWLSSENATRVELLDAGSGVILGEEAPTPDGGEPSRLRNDWLSPDGASIAAVALGAIEIRDVATDRVTTIIPEQRGFSFALAWSPDSKWVALINGPHYEARQSRLIVAAADGSTAPKDLAPAATPADFYNGPALWLDWSPDSRTIAFVHDGELWTADVASGAIRQRLAAGLPVLTEPRWSPDGRKIAFRAAGTGGTYVANADGSDNRYLAPATAARLSPDGERIAFEYGAKIFTIGVDGTEPVALGRVQSFVTVMTDFYPRHFCGFQFPPSPNPPVWSPDGRFVAFERGLDPPDILIARTNGSSAPAVVGQGWAASWSPDSATFAYVRECAVHLVNFDAGRAGPEKSSVPGYAYAWRADGTLLVSDRGQDSTLQADPFGNVLWRFPGGTSLSPAGDIYAVREFRRSGHGPSAKVPHRS